MSWELKLIKSGKLTTENYLEALEKQQGSLPSISRFALKEKLIDEAALLESLGMAIQHKKSVEECLLISGSLTEEAYSLLLEKWNKEMPSLSEILVKEFQVKAQDILEALDSSESPSEEPNEDEKVSEEKNSEGEGADDPAISSIALEALKEEMGGMDLDPSILAELEAESGISHDTSSSESSDESSAPEKIDNTLSESLEDEDEGDVDSDGVSDFLELYDEERKTNIDHLLMGLKENIMNKSDQDISGSLDDFFDHVHILRGALTFINAKISLSLTDDLEEVVRSWNRLENKDFPDSVSFVEEFLTANSLLYDLRNELAKNHSEKNQWKDEAWKTLYLETKKKLQSFLNQNSAISA